jgi:CubicO group peptidase (beta-lactamase class C family)
MTGSFATADDPRAADMATGHQQWFGRWRPVELAYDDAGTAMGYIASTASDLATFMQAHLDGHPAIPASAADIITGTVVPTGWDTPLDAGYGHGWFIDERAGTPWQATLDRSVTSPPTSFSHPTPTASGSPSCPTQARSSQATKRSTTSAWDCSTCSSTNSRSRPPRQR